MRNLSVATIGILALLLSGPKIVRAEKESWPVRGAVDLSSSFCDFRAGHFHGGIDIRTGGAEGREVFAPVDGYIWRIRYSYFGYGKSIYLKDSLGYIYVFGHLSRLAARFEKVIRGEQYRQKRYIIDQYYDDDSLMIRRGELLAYAGQTGAGPPHLHFEKRTPSNLPLHPLTNGFPIEDKIPPVVETLGFDYVDDFSVFPNGERGMTVTVSYDRELQKYFIDSTVVLSGPFGLKLKTFDRIRPQGPRLNIYRLRLLIDDYITYENSFDRYDYAETRMVDLLFDYEAAVSSKDYQHLLYNPPGKNFSGSKSLYKEGGIFTFVNENSFGLHNGRIEIYDAAGNKSELLFKFSFHPQGPLFRTEWVNDTVFYLVAQPYVQYLDIDHIQVHSLASGSAWKRLRGNHIEKRGRTDYRVILPPESSRWRALKIEVVGNSAWSKNDQYLPLNLKVSHRQDWDYSLSDGGILFHLDSRDIAPPAPSINIVYDDGYIENIIMTPVAANRFVGFYRNHSVSSKITAFKLYSGDVLLDSVAVDIHLLGYSDREKTLEPVGGFRIITRKSNFYRPLFARGFEKSGWFPEKRDIISPVYAVEPSIFPLAEAVTLSFHYDDSISPEKIGIGKLNKDNGWSWITPKAEGEWFSASSNAFGTFALLKDDEAPRVSQIYPGDGKTVPGPRPQIRFSLNDNLSGIGSDQQLIILIDGDWVIPEYDPELSLVKTEPARPLSAGRHTLEIKATDMAGNTRTVKTSFYTK